MGTTIKQIWIVESGKLVRHERLGKCLACGDCCRKFNYRCSYANAERKDAESEDGEVDWPAWEGWAAEDWDDEGTWIWWGLFEIIPLDKPKCRRFDPKTNYCEQFGTKDWREICRKFPFRPADLKGLDNCGFSFRRID